MFRKRTASDEENRSAQVHVYDQCTRLFIGTEKTVMYTRLSEPLTCEAHEH